MSIKRIAWGVVVGVVVMVVAYVAWTWPDWCKTTNFVRAEIDERLHPQEWQLGDVHVVREEPEDHCLVLYRANLNESTLWFVTAKGEDGKVYRAGGVVKDSGLYVGVLPAEETLREELPEPLGEAADTAQQVAQEMRKHKPWPWSLRSIGRRVRDVAERKMRVEAYTEPDRGLFCSEVLYGSERAISISTFGDWVQMTVWDDRIVARIKNSVLDFADTGNTTYVDEDTDISSLQSRVIGAIDAAFEVIQVSPATPADAIEMLGRARRRFESQDYKRADELDSDARYRLTSPWHARIVQTDLRGVPAVSPEKALVQPATVAGVDISEQLDERGFGRLVLEKDDVSIICRFDGGKSRLGIERGGQGIFSLNVTEDPEFPKLTARFGGEEQEVLDEVRAMARDMLGVPLEEWAVFMWRDDLLSALKGVDESRFYARSEPKRYGVNAHVMAEGDSLTCSLSQNTILRQTSVGSLDVLLDAGGFKAYDQRSGSLLVIDGNEVRLTQRREDTAEGKAFDMDTFVALAEMLRDYEDEVPEELRQSLDVLVAFAAELQIPQASLVDILEAPFWSTEHRQKRIEAFQQLAKFTIRD